MRIILAVSLGISILFFPPWASLTLAVVMCVRYRAWEVIVLGLFADMISLPEVSWTVIPWATILALVLVWGLEPLRRELLSNAGPFGVRLFRQ